MIGLGYWGSKWVDIFNKLGVVGWVCDSDRDKLKAYSSRFKVTNDARDVINDLRTDAVVVATPALTHFKLVQSCLRANKDVLVEKPFALTVAEAQELVSTAQSRSRVLMASHTFLYNDAIQCMKRIMDNGGMGKLTHAYSRRTNLGPWIMDVNVLWDIGPHDISILRYLLSEDPTHISVLGGSRFNELPGVCFINLRFPSGVIGNIHLSWFDFFKTRTVTVTGEKAMVITDDYAGREKATVQLQSFRLDGRNLVSDAYALEKIDVSNTLENEAKHFIQCLQDRKTPLTSGEEALLVTKILECGDMSMRHNGEWEAIQW